MGLLQTYQFIAGHPLTQDQKLAALRRWLNWQLASRIARHPIAVPFVNEMRILAKTGMTGATGNIYCGLHEFEDMAFVLHFLRAGDLFADIGANVGSYTLLAAATGASVVSFEPVPATFECLLDNVHLNRLTSQVDARNQAVGGHSGSITMTADQDTTNKALGQGEYAGQTVEVAQVTLDDAFQNMAAPSLLKIDVEGSESEVMKGALSVLADRKVEAVIMELNGSGLRYGFDDNALHTRMLAAGFSSCRYEPRQRRIVDLNGQRSTRGNGLYVRDPASVQARVSQSPTYHVAGADL